MSYNQYDLANTSLVKTGGLTEMYIPLWWYSSGVTSSTAASNNATTYATLTKGTTASFAGSGPANGSSTKLHTLSSNWSPSQQFAFEVSISISSSAASMIAMLYDFTSLQFVSGATVSTTSTTATVVRSGKFALTPGHAYGVAFQNNGSTSFTSYLTKASLVAFIGG